MNIVPVPDPYVPSNVTTAMSLRRMIRRYISMIVCTFLKNKTCGHLEFSMYVGIKYFKSLTQFFPLFPLEGPQWVPEPYQILSNLKVLVTSPKGSAY